MKNLKFKKLKFKLPRPKRGHMLKAAAALWCAALLVAGGAAGQRASAATYYQGSQGEGVKKIQQKLIDWGYMTGTADGIYGSKTAQAVKSFQKNNGLTADGVAGSKTLEALGITEGGASQQTVTDGSAVSRSQELQLLSRIISAEARGEPYNGQVAVGAVIMNRVKHPSFPNTLAGVIYQPGAFSAITDGQFEEEIYEISVRAAQDALNGMDPSGGAIYYYNPEKTTNAWIYSRPVIKTIGKHVFAG